MRTGTAHNVLVIDDDQDVCKMLAGIVGKLGHHTRCTHSLQQGMAALASASFDVVLLDVNLPDGIGLDLLSEIRQFPSNPDIIIITGYCNSDGAKIAIRNGAWDYIPKSDPYHKVALSLKRVLQYRSDRPKRESIVKPLDKKGLVGDSDAMKNCYRAMAKASGNLAHVLITGETGTGKELFARAIHANSPHVHGNLVVVDCASLPENLVESLLFGHEKGAFTGADRYREGLISQADKGSLFLDEVGEMPLTIQKKFLRVLQERRCRPVGGSHERASNFRLIAATNQDLDQMVAKGLFRRDLLYRLRASHILLPALRHREGDVRQLALHYTDKICQRYEIGTKRLSEDFIETLESYSWPGNVRELINMLESVVSGNMTVPKLFAAHLPEYIRLNAITSALPSLTVEETPDTAPGAMINDSCLAPSLPSQSMPPLKEFRQVAIASAEKKYLNTLLSSLENNITEAMNISGLSRSRFYELVKRHQL